ncbi:MAG: HAMP domain-containing protein [Desulfobacterales bacterium]|nr:HAMP domain-containing protein [Desulfobacterales bacterium]
MNKVAEGNLKVEPALYESKDEIGQLSGSFNIMADNLSNLIKREQLLRDIITTSISSYNVQDIVRNFS